MTELAYYTLVLALGVALYSAVAAVSGSLRGFPELIRSAERGVLAVLGLLGFATTVLMIAFLTDDFSLAYVTSYSSRKLSVAYKVAALYGGQDGSLLFWIFLLAVFVVIVARQNRRRYRELMPYVIAISMTVAVFFLTVLVFFANPFERLSFPPPDGRGLNPLLQNPGMFFHPPTLYIGYVGFTIPFAFALSALITGRLGTEWITSTRRWTIFAWFFLTLGNMFGAWWAYRILGWGGYWAWDPVENASFLPWLTGTAYLHSVMIQEKKGMLKVWNIVLVILTFALSIFGTFLTRSGVLSSVHTFAESSLGPLFLGFLGLILIVSFGFLFLRLPELKSQHELDALLSRESSFLVNNLLFLGIAFTTLWGTIFPLIAEAVRGVKVTVGPPFYNQVIVPIGLTLLLVTGICPLIAWRRASWANFKRNFLPPFLFSLIGLIFLFVLGMQRPLVLFTFFLLLFVASAIGLEFYRGARARRRIIGVNFSRALGGLVWRNKRRYGGYIIHLGVLLLVLAIAGGAFQVEREAHLQVGEAIELGRYRLKYEGPLAFERGDTMVVGARIAVSNAGKPLAVLVPEKRLHEGSDQPHTMAAILSSLKEDLYIILASVDDHGIAVRALINPLMIWMWIGSYVIGLGTLVVMWPEGKRSSAVGREGR